MRRILLFPLVFALILSTAPIAVTAAQPCAKVFEKTVAEADVREVDEAVAVLTWFQNGETHTRELTVEELIGYASALPNDAVAARIELVKDVSVTTQGYFSARWALTADITLDGNGHVMQFPDSQRSIVIQQNTSVTIQDITLTGKANDSVIYVAEGGTLTLAGKVNVENTGGADEVYTADWIHAPHPDLLLENASTPAVLLSPTFSTDKPICVTVGRGMSGVAFRGGDGDGWRILTQEDLAMFQSAYPAARMSLNEADNTITFTRSPIAFEALPVFPNEGAVAAGGGHVSLVAEVNAAGGVDYTMTLENVRLGVESNITNFNGDYMGVSPVQYRASTGEHDTWTILLEGKNVIVGPLELLSPYDIPLTIKGPGSAVFSGGIAGIGALEHKPVLDGVAALDPEGGEFICGDENMPSGKVYWCLADSNGEQCGSYTMIGPAHEHTYSAQLTADWRGHAHECELCDHTLDRALHVRDGGTVTKAPTVKETGIKTYTCSVCGYVMQTEILPKLEENDDPYTMTADDGRHLYWSRFPEGELYIDGDLAPDDRVVAGSYDSQGRLLSAVVIEPQTMFPTDLDAALVKLFWLDAEQRPLSASKVVWPQ